MSITPSSSRSSSIESTSQRNSRSNNQNQVTVFIRRKHGPCLEKFITSSIELYKHILIPNLFKHIGKIKKVIQIISPAKQRQLIDLPSSPTSSNVSILSSTPSSSSSLESISFEESESLVLVKIGDKLIDVRKSLIFSSSDVLKGKLEWHMNQNKEVFHLEALDIVSPKTQKFFRNYFRNKEKVLEEKIFREVKENVFREVVECARIYNLTDIINLGDDWVLENYLKERDVKNLPGLLDFCKHYNLNGSLDYLNQKEQDAMHYLKKWLVPQEVGLGFTRRDESAEKNFTRYGLYLTEACLDLSNLSRKDFKLFIDSCPNLLSLECSKMGPKKLKILSESFSQLESLKLTQCKKSIQDSCIIKMSSHLKNLKIFSLEDLKHITDKSIFALAENLHALEELSFVNCPQLTYQAITYLIPHQKTLKQLHLPESMRNTFLNQVLDQYSNLNVHWHPNEIQSSNSTTPIKKRYVSVSSDFTESSSEGE